MSSTTLEMIREVERETRLAPETVMARYLQETLGQRTAAYVAGVADAKMVGRWARGKHRPRGIASDRIRTAFEVTKLIGLAYNAETAKAWLLGSNSRLDDEAPAYVIRHAQSLDDLRLVVPTARAFAGERP
jgi:hypothetical protein